jgi:hypothetical protein
MTTQKVGEGEGEGRGEEMMVMVVVVVVMMMMMIKCILPEDTLVHEGKRICHLCHVSGKGTTERATYFCKTCSKKLFLHMDKCYKLYSTAEDF